MAHSNDTQRRKNKGGPRALRTRVSCSGKRPELRICKAVISSREKERSGAVHRAYTEVKKRKKKENQVRIELTPYNMESQLDRAPIQPQGLSHSCNGPGRTFLDSDHRCGKSHVTKRKPCKTGLDTKACTASSWDNGTYCYATITPLVLELLNVVCFFKSICLLSLHNE